MDITPTGAVVASPNKPNMGNYYDFSQDRLAYLATVT